MNFFPRVSPGARGSANVVAPIGAAVRLVVLLLATVLGAGLAGAHAASHDDQRSSREILAEIKDKKDRSPQALFEQLGERKDSAGLKALEQAFGELKSEAKMTQVARAFRHFAGTSKLERKALASLERMAKSDEATAARAAAKGLVAFGPAAHEVLVDVIEDGEDAVARAHALAPLLASIEKNPTDDGLELFLTAWRAPMSSNHARATEVLMAYRTVDALAAMGEVVSDEDAYLGLRELLVTAVGQMKLEGEAAEEADEVVDRGLAAEVDSIVHRALESVIARGRALRDRPIEALTKSESMALRRLANVALARMELAKSPNALDDVLDLASKKDPAARQAAALELARDGSEEALATLNELLADEDRRVRSEAIRAMAARRRPSSIVALIDRLDEETGKHRLEVHWALRMLTGEDHGSRSPRWNSWWRGEGETFRIPTLAEAQDAERKRKERKDESPTKATFYGLKVVSDRLAFVIDTSGSMNAKVYKGGTRLDAAKEQLAGVIEGLHGDDQFNIIAFESRVRPWEDELVKAESRNREDAADFVDGLRANGGTAIYDALREAFDDESIDTIYFLSDGQPSGGLITDATQIRDEVARWNSARHVTINCVAVGQDHALLRGLAEDSGGEYKRIE